MEGPGLSYTIGRTGPSLAAGTFCFLACACDFATTKTAGVWGPALPMAGKLVSRFLYIVKSTNTLPRYSNFAVFCGFLKKTVKDV